jgi:hypothetical protein
MNHYYLVISSLFLSIPLFVFFINSKNKNTYTYEFILALLLFINICFSLMFWMCPIKDSLIHIYDGLFAKFSAVLFVIYVFIYKKISYSLKTLCFTILLLCILLFYYSNKYSTNDWCSDKHILCHSIFHVLVSIGNSFDFI